MSLQNYDHSEVITNIVHEGSSVSVTFHKSKGVGLDLSLVEGLDATLIEKINQAHIKLLPYEKEIMQWIDRSPENANLYITNPLHAIEISGIGMPKEIQNELQDLSQILLTKVGK